MKNLKISFLFVLASIFSFKAFAQTTDAQSTTITKFYRFITSVELQECNIKGDTTGLKSKYINDGNKFTIYNDRSVKDNYVIKIWLWVDTTNSDFKSKRSLKANTFLKSTYNANPTTREEKAANWNFYTNESGNLVSRYFLLPKADLIYQAEPLYTNWQPVAGTAVLPFKFRPQQSVFTKDVSLSSLGGVKHVWSNSASINIVSGIGISSVSVDAESTNNFVSKSSDLAAISLPLGAVLEYKGIQLGLFTGWDWISNNNDYHWRYQGKNWFAIGLGISIFSNELEKKKSEDSKQ